VGLYKIHLQTKLNQKPILGLRYVHSFLPAEFPTRNSVRNRFIVQYFEFHMTKATSDVIIDRMNYSLLQVRKKRQPLGPFDCTKLKYISPTSS
jgi:hypothetical protein